MTTINTILKENIKPYTWRLIVVLVFMFFTAGFEALLPWPFKFLIDNVLGDEPLDHSSFPGTFIPHFQSPELLGYFVVFLFFVFSLGVAFSEYYESILVKSVLKDIMLRFSEAAFRNLELFNIGIFRDQQVGDYIYRLSYDVSALGSLIESGILPIITSGLYLLITTIILFTISVKLTLISLTVLPFLAAGLYFFNKRLVTVTKRSEYWNSALFSFVEQALNQLKIIQSFSQEKKEAYKFDQRMATSLNTELNMYHLDFLLSLLVAVIIAISYALIIGIGIKYFYEGELTTGLLVIFIFYLDNLTAPILNIIYAWSEVKETRVRVNRMGEFFNKHMHAVDSGKTTVLTEPSIEFRNVSLEVEGDVKILDNVSFKIEPNTLTVLVGVSGSGKTSLISLIPRFISEATKGEILIGGKNIKEYKIEALRQSISYVPQENSLFSDTIQNVIAFGKENATDDEIKEAARLAVADEFIHDHPHAYKFHVGEGGNYLSGGQRQRLSIARAFIKQAPIVIMDEPLSALDIQTRAAVWKNIHDYAKGKTAIIVTNILDVISQADLVIVMSKGKVVEVGKHEDLLKKSKYFHYILRTD